MGGESITCGPASRWRLALRAVGDRDGRPLSGRHNIVLARDPQWTPVGAKRAGSIANALELAAQAHPAAGLVLG